MSEHVDSTLHEKAIHGTTDFPGAIYGDSYKFLKDEYYYAHYHEEIEIITCKTGKISILVNETKYILDEGDILFINSNSVHWVTHNEYPDSYVLPCVYHPRLLKLTGASLVDKNIVELIHSLGFEAIEFHNDEIAKELISLEMPVRNNDVSAKMDLLITLLKIYNYIYKNYDKLCTKNKESSSNEKTRKALQYIYNNYDKDISLKDIANIMNLSEGEASRMFKRVTKESPIEYLVKYRINMSSYYLRNTDKPITEIAFLVGFSSSNYFTIAFKKITDMTPREYRIQQKMLSRGEH